MSLFSQDLKQFLTSKTNWIGMGMVVMGVTGLITGDLQTYGAVQSIFGGLGFIAVKDAIFKV